MIKRFYKTKRNILILLIAVVTTNKLTAQVSINGPGCVIPGITYQYSINGSWNDSAIIKVCITGGKLISGERCTPGNVKTTSVLVIWNDTTYWKLEVTSSLGNSSIMVQATTDLKGGEIDNEDKVKVFDSTVTSYTFRCEAASGGSCTPNYLYQWQRSEDALNWTNITNAIGKDLQFSGSIIVNTFFRRVTKETNSNTVAYSDTGILAVPF